MVGYFCSSSLKIGHRKKIHWTDGNQVVDAVHHQSNSQLQNAQHPRVSLVVRNDKILLIQKTAKALYYSGKEDDPGSRKQNQETQVLDSKLAWMIHCVIC